MAENYTTYTEVDPNSRITITSATRIDYTGLARNEAARVYIDKGVGYYSGDFKFNLDVNITSGSATGIVFLFKLDNFIGGNPQIAIQCNATSGSMALYLNAAPGGLQDGSTNLSLSTTYYLTIIRDESVGTYGTAYCYIYSDSARTTLVDTLVVTLQEKTDFRYLFGLMSYNDGATDVQTGYVENLTDLTDHASSLTETDTVTAADSVSLTAYKTITDSIALTEGFLLNGASYIFITDSVAATDGAITSYKEVRILDTVTGADIAGSINQNSLMFGVTGFPSGQTVEYRIKNQQGVVVQDWTSVDVLEDLEITGYSTYIVTDIILDNGFQGKISWRINGTNYYAVEILNYFESFVFGQISVSDIEASTIIAKEATVAALPTLSEIEGSSVLAKEATLEGLQTDTAFLLSCIRNKKYLSKVGSTWYLIIRNAGDTADILNKALKDKGGADITDITAGAMSSELASSV